MEDLIAIARAVRTRGLKGEIVADLLTDFPERFEGLSRLIAVAPGGRREVVRIRNHWFHQGRLILQLVGYDTIEAAKKFVGFEFAVPESERMELSADHFYDWELEGCRVRNVNQEPIGTVSGILRTGGVDALIVQGNRKNEHLIPLAKQIVVDIDLQKKVILVDPIEGLLEL